MNTVSRGIRNAFRNKIRTFSIVIIVGLSIGLSLSMFVAHQAVQDKISSVKSSIGNTISISPAGVRGFQGGGEPLTVAQVATVSSTEHVSSVVTTLSDRLTSDTSNLTSAVEAGTLGNRSGSSSGVGFQQGPPPESPDGGSVVTQDSTTRITRTFTPPVIITGSSNMELASTYGGDTVSFVSGSALDPSSTDFEAVVGKALAEKNNLTVGSSFTAYGQTITVKGVFDTGNTFSNAGLVMNIKTLQTLSSQAGAVTSATAYVDSTDNLSSTVSAIQTSLGDTADVVSNQDTVISALEPLENVKTISLYSLFGSLVAGAIVILLTMVMIVRERRREIGVLKAIGSSNIRTMLQFVSEAATLTILGMIAGIMIGAVAAGPITNTLVTNSTNSNPTSQEGAEGFRVRGPAQRGIGASISAARSVQATVGADLIAYGFGAALLIAVVGSALPALLISKVRPADVMRME